MSDAWSSVVPSVVTSAITTIVTMGIVGGTRAIKNRGALDKAPLILQRQSGPSWVIVNRTKRNLTGVGANALRPAVEGGEGVLAFPQHWQIDIHGGILYPNQGAYAGELRDGDSVTVNWVTLGRSKAKRWHSASTRIRGDEDEFIFRLEPSMVGQA